MAHARFHVRPYQRLPVHCSLYVQTEHTHDTGTLWNVSLEGCRISTTLALQVGTQVALLILLPEPGGAMLIKTALVCWTRGPDYGLRLVTLHPVEAACLDRYVTQAVGEAVDTQPKGIDHRPLDAGFETT
jgi:hypothetical protein